MIIPSIDLIDGKAVQLRQGEEKVLEEEDVEALARRFSLIGEIAVIDLDAAMEQGDNRDLIRDLVRRYPCRVGGGIRSAEQARELLRWGARKVIIGTAASEELLRELKPEHVIVAVDEKAGRVVDKAWTRATSETVIERINRLEPFCSGFLYTMVEREGMLQGVALERVREVAEATDRTVTAAGGITTIEEVRDLADLECEAQLGMAIYTGRLNLEELFVELVDFEKQSGLVPTIVSDEDLRPLMLAYSTKQSLARALRERAGIYWSRSRESLWKKGETSGHTQKLHQARFDCDRDTLRFTVSQRGGACHRGTDSCWGNLPNSLRELEVVLKDRLDSPTDSFGSSLMQDETMILRKLHEEVFEVTHASGKQQTIYEAADVAFFLTALLVRRDISWDTILQELRGRQKPE